MRTENKRSEILNIGKDAIQRIGYHSFNYHQIATKLSIKNASVHYYYPNKEQLGLDIINGDMLNFEIWTKQTRGITPWEKIESLFAKYESYLKDEQKLCIIGSFSASYQDIPESLQHAVRQYLGKVILWLTECFEDGRKNGDFQFHGTTAGRAALFAAALPGSLQTARTQGNEEFYLVIDQLRQSLNG